MHDVADPWVLWNPTPAATAEVIATVREHRAGSEPFDVVISGRTLEQPAQARAVVEPIEQAGSTWWLEGFRPEPDS